MNCMIYSILSFLSCYRNLSNNRLSGLHGKIFPDNCFLSIMDFSNNPITEIDDEIFESSYVTEL